MNPWWLKPAGWFLVGAHVVSIALNVMWVIRMPEPIATLNGIAAAGLIWSGISLFRWLTGDCK